MSDEKDENLSTFYTEAVCSFGEMVRRMATERITPEDLRAVFGLYEPREAATAIQSLYFHFPKAIAAAAGMMFEGLAHLAREAGGIAALAALSPVVPSEEMNRTIEQAAFGFLRRDEPQMVDAPDLLM